MKLPEWAKWVARDENGELYVFEIKPIKRIDLGAWVDNECDCDMVYETDDTFSHVKWEDEYPTIVDKDRNTFKWLEKPDLLPTRETLNEVFGSKPDEKPTEVEMPTLREWVKWLARDENDELWCFATKPYKECGRWHSEDPRCAKVGAVSEIYNIIQWTDKEPTEVISGLETPGISVTELNRIMNAKAHGYYEVPEVADKTERVHVDKDMEVIKYDWLTENRMVNEADIIADKHGIETIDVIRTFGNDDMIAGFYWGNAIEYMTHYRNKNGLEDLKEARRNLDWLIEHTERVLIDEENEFFNY